MTNEKILIVDDQKFNLEILVAVLGDGYDLRVALDGRTALSLAFEDPPQLVLLDVTLPDLSGYEICRILKGDPRTRETAVIFVTGLGDSESEVRGLGLGAVDFIAKPFNPVLVKARVDSQLTLLRTHKSLLQQKEKLEEAERLASLGRLLAGLAHALNTPLGNALLASSTLLEAVRQDQIRVFPPNPSSGADEASQQVLSLLQLIDRSLRTATGTLGQVIEALVERKSAPVEVVSIAEVLGQVLAQFHGELEARNVKVEVNGDPQDALETCALDLYDLLFHLVSWCLSSTKAVKQIGVNHAVSSSGHLILDVHHDGILLQEADVEHFFEPSFWFTTNVESKGLATYLIYSLTVHQLKGTVSAQTRGPDGMTYHLEIPPMGAESPRL